jgi:hypothetical protein
MSDTTIIAFDMGDDCPFFDRYRVVFVTEDDGEWALSIGPTGNHPQGVCMTTECVSTEPVRGEVTVEVDALPARVQRAIENEIRLYHGYLAESR